MKTMIIVAKIGGSLINDKSQKIDRIEELVDSPSKYIRFDVLENFAIETSRALSYLKKNQEVELWLSHGAGLCHRAVDQYGISEKVREFTRFLNTQVTRILSRSLPVVSLGATGTVFPVGRKFDVDKMIRAGKEIVSAGKIPLSCGDVVGKDKLEIFSADDYVECLATKLNADKAIMFMDVPLSTEDPKINPNAKPLKKLTRLDELKISLDPMDKTGGLLGKITKLQRVRKQGIDCKIVDTMIKGNVYKALIGEDVPAEILESLS